MTQKSSGFFNWINSRLPIVNTYERHLSKHPVPKKVNFWYMFGALASVVLIIQIVSGIWLMFGYENTEEGAFASIEYIMRDIEYGWVIRYMHTTGASMFFAVVYLHMFRGLLYGSYHKPRELVWVFGMTIYLVMMAEGFLRICFALWSNVLLGRSSYHLSFWSYSIHWRIIGDLG